MQKGSSAQKHGSRLTRRTIPYLEQALHQLLKLKSDTIKSSSEQAINEIYRIHYLHVVLQMRQWLTMVYRSSDPANTPVAAKIRIPLK